MMHWQFKLLYVSFHNIIIQLQYYFDVVSTSACVWTIMFDKDRNYVLKFVRTRCVVALRRRNATTQRNAFGVNEPLDCLLSRRSWSGSFVSNEFRFLVPFFSEFFLVTFLLWFPCGELNWLAATRQLVLGLHSDSVTYRFVSYTFR